jgi:hypothetical protein
VQGKDLKKVFYQKKRPYKAIADYRRNFKLEKPKYRPTSGTALN